MTQTLDVQGMSCEGCEEAVEEALEPISGVQSVAADHENDTVSVEGDADTDELVGAIEDAGYEPSHS